MGESRKSYVEAILGNQELLNKQQESNQNFYRDWDRNARETQSMGPDYDYALAAKAGLKVDNRGHLGDIGKLPNHPTYSGQSYYAGLNMGKPGKWIGNVYHVSDKLGGPELRRKVMQLKRMQDSGQGDGDMYKVKGKLIL